MNKKISYFVVSCLTAFVLTACASDQSYVMNDENGVYKIGGRYQINGKWYEPKEDFKYKQDGIASWYGEDFHKQKTANGEIYNMHKLSASHKTLPLPSIVKVTNLENGKSEVVRVNDRGPFVNNRIIDVSKEVARRLGFLEAGTAKVRVEILEKESRKLKQSILDKGGRIINGSPIEGSDAGQAMYVNPATNEPVVLISQPAQVSVEDNEPIYSPSKKRAAQPVKTTVAKTTTAKTAAKSTTVQVSRKAMHEKGFFIQLGAFKDYDKAMSVKQRFDRFGNIQITKTISKSAPLYRVRIGSYSDPEDAVKTMDRIRSAMHYSDMRLIEVE